MEEAKTIIRDFDIRFEEDIQNLKEAIQAEYTTPIFTIGSMKMAQVVEMPNHRYWMLVHNDRLIGLIGVIILNENQAELKRFYLHQKFRSLPEKWANQLIEKVIQWCDFKEIKQLYLGTMEVLKAANKFYLKQGFSSISKKELPTEIEIHPLDDTFYIKGVGNK